MLVLPYYCYCYCYYCLFSFSFLIPRTPPLLDNNKTSFFLISPPISMNSSYHSSFPPFSIDLNQDLYYDNQLEPVAAVHASSSSSLPSYPLFINPSPQEQAYYQRELQPAQLQDQADAYVSGSFFDRGTLKIKNDEAAGICKKEEGDIGNQEDRSLKWVSSKVRLMKKMIRPEDQTTAVALPASIQKFDHDREDFKKIISPPPQPDNNSSSSSSNNNNTTVRVCSDCNTTKTPLWRSGPRGPKSLCNACGIRQRKARRAMAAAAASAAGSTTFGANNTDHEMKPVKANVQIQKKEKKPMSKGTGGSSNSNNNTANHNSHLPFKKRCTQKAARSARKINIKTSKICLEDLTIILSKKYSSSFQQVFPQDEKDAAILLMALSYGALVHG